MTARYALEVPTEACSLRLVRAFAAPLFTELCRGLGVEEGLADRLVLALDEACSNVVRHRCHSLDDGRVRVDIDVLREPSGADLTVSLRAFCRTDQQAGVAPKQVEPGATSGRGLQWVHEIMDRVSLVPARDRESRAVDLVLEKRISNGSMGDDE